ncbi:MAG: SEL1-like repeat protein [Gammaproteobacteria bacterium]|jgi:TPR repeat protein|nr:SEL1-like repeat protein [Gammaproteobacteria bacterium]
MLLVASSVLAQSGFDKGASAYKRGDFETALAVFRPLAENGDAKAQSILGLMYSYGEGVPVDYREAARWYRRAAEQSSSVAQYNLGMFYLEGKGVSQNTDEAIKWLAKSADGGHFRARSELAKLDGGSYSDLTSPPSDSLEAPPTMTAAQAEPRSVVLRKPQPAVPEPKTAPETTASAATAMTVSATPTPAKRNDQTNDHTKANNHANNNARAAQPPTSNNRAYRVQLASSRSEEYIRRDWSSYQKRYSDIFDGLDASVERAEIGEEKTVWYRLRVGPFASAASAKELCAKLAARNIKTGCLPLRTTR